MREHGTGKSAVKDAICAQKGKRIKVVQVARTMHTYFNTVKILLHAGIMRKANNLCLSCLIEALRRRNKILISTISIASSFSLTGE